MLFKISIAKNFITYKNCNKQITSIIAFISKHLYLTN